MCSETVLEVRCYKSMIEQQVEDVFVERSLLVRQETIARRNYKLANWLKLLSLHQQNQDPTAVDRIIRDEIHPNFVMQEHFWLAQTQQRIHEQVLSRNDAQLLMLALQDGHYLQVATLLANTLLNMYRNKALGETFLLSVLETIVALFDHCEKVAPFFRMIREIYQAGNNVRKTRLTFERELRLAHDDFDLVWDEYSLWEPQPEVLEGNRELYWKAKSQWEREVEDFDDNLCSELNVKKSLINLESQNESKINQERYMCWLEKLPTETQQLWFLRRVVLNYRQLIHPYLAKLQQLHQNDPETMIKHYQVAIRLSQHSKEVELKYLHFLARRINRHLLNEALPESYNQQWADNVGFFRNELVRLVEEPRVGVGAQQAKELFREYYGLWIEVEEKMVRDKEAVSQLYEKLIKETGEVERYQDYAGSLVNLGAVKEAKNVMRRYVFHAQDQHSKDAFLRFIEIYGDVHDLKQFQAHKHPHNINQQQVTPPAPETGTEPPAEPKDEHHPSGKQAISLKRERPAEDETELKIYEATRKKLHMDGDFTVYLKGIPTDWSESDVLKVLVHPEEVVRVSMVVKKGEQRDYCYIEFKSKEAAEQELKDNKSPYQLLISKPPSEYDESSTLFLCALPETADESKLRRLFGEHQKSIVEIRLKLDREKNYAYVEFSSAEEKEGAFQEVRKQALVVDGKKVIVQRCDSSRARNKKFMPVVFLKKLAYKAQAQDIRNFFQGKQLTSVHIPLSRDKGKPQGFAYVEFAKFKDYQEALDLRKGTLFGREFLILKSDRPIHPSGHHPETPQKQGSRSKAGKGDKEKESQHQEKDNHYFSNLFK